VTSKGSRPTSQVGTAHPYDLFAQMESDPQADKAPALCRLHRQDRKRIANRKPKRMPPIDAKPKYHPTFDEYRALAGRWSVVPIYRVLLSDTLTPVLAFRKVADERSNSFLFESVVGGEKVGRYSFVGSEPFLHFEAYEGHVKLEVLGPERRGANLPEPFERDSQDPLAELEQLLSLYRAPHLPGLPRFSSGAVGYLAYDAVRYIEHLPNAPPDDRKLPDVAFDFYDVMVIFDHICKTVAVTACAHVPADTTEAKLKQAYEDACKRIDRMVQRLEQPANQLALADVDPGGPVSRQFRSNFTRQKFEDAVRRCKDYIRAGDVFQVVISQRLETETTASPFQVYRTLRVVNPSPFMFYLVPGRTCLVGSSPEIMVRAEDDLITIRPLAGTRRRGATDEEDRALAAELLADPKERAEHVMLVDLGRNDVGRIARYRTVQLSDVMTVERYSHVMHITSNVTGRLAPGKTPLDALRACLPAGTVSGAPKVRAMEIIDEIEPHRRGPYAGAVGYVDFTGNMDTCIALRTMVFLDNKVYLQAGAGIVYDSVPSREYEETINKAKGLLKAIEIAERQMQQP